MLHIHICRASGGKLVDATPEVEAKYKSEIDRVERTFGATAGEDFTKFPVFKFAGKIYYIALFLCKKLNTGWNIGYRKQPVIWFLEGNLEPVGVQVDTKADITEEVEEELEEHVHWLDVV